MIFLFYVVMKEEVRRFWMIKFRCIAQRLGVELEMMDTGKVKFFVTIISIPP